MFPSSTTTILPLTTLQRASTISTNATFSPNLRAKFAAEIAAANGLPAFRRHLRQRLTSAGRKCV